MALTPAPVSGNASNVSVITAANGVCVIDTRGGAPGGVGADKQVMFNANGRFSGNSTFVYNYTNGNVGIGTTTPGVNSNFTNIGLEVSSGSAAPNAIIRLSSAQNGGLKQLGNLAYIDLRTMDNLGNPGAAVLQIGSMTGWMGGTTLVNSNTVAAIGSIQDLNLISNAKTKSIIKLVGNTVAIGLGFAANGAYDFREIPSGAGNGLNPGGANATLVISKYAAASMPINDIANSYYLGLGCFDYNASLPTYRLIGFGFSGNSYPAYVGYAENNDSGFTSGHLIFGTRNVTTDTQPSERMRITAAGDVVIGMTANSVSAGGSRTCVSVNGGTDCVMDYYNGGSLVGHIYALSGTEFRLAALNSSTPMTFLTNSSERMRILTGGQFLIGTTNANDAAGLGHRMIIEHVGGSSEYGLGIRALANTTNLVTFVNGGNAVAGSITLGTTTVAFNTSSDYRLKSNVVSLQNATGLINLLKPSEFDWYDGSRGVGFIAHELQEVIPSAVHGEKDAIKRHANGAPELTDSGQEIIIPQQVDHSKLVPYLIAAVQELSSRVKELEAKLAAKH
jgi:hypothetical protein